jgi:hypothetical protein
MADDDKFGRFAVKCGDCGVSVVAQTRVEVFAR